MAQYVYAKQNAATTHRGRTVRTKRGEAWHASDPLVREHPDLFAADPPTVRGTPAEGPVEQATAAPGEKRTTRRTRSRSRHTTTDATVGDESDGAG